MTLIVRMTSDPPTKWHRARPTALLRVSVDAPLRRWLRVLCTGVAIQRRHPFLEIATRTPKDDLCRKCFREGRMISASSTRLS